MSVFIPAAVLDFHENVVDDLIDGELGTACTLVYPEKRQSCHNCLFDNINNRSANVYKTGGPKPFSTNQLCPHCGGRGFLALAATEVIRLRVYWDYKSWKDIGIQVADPERKCVVIGYMSDLANVEKADHLLLHNNLDNREYKVVRDGEAQPWGFRRNRYFRQVLSKS